jgi:hypothetical protein
MNRAFCSTLLWLITLGISAQDISSQYAQTITAEDLKKHLVIIASDSLEGRDTGSPGQKKAAEYVAKHFQSYGLTPIAKDKSGQASYYQPYTLYQRGWGEVYLRTPRKRYEYGKDFFINGLLSIPSETSIATVFVGYGIEAARYTDYEGVDITGKAVIMWEGEPQDKAGNYLVSGTNEKSKWSGPNAWQQKAALAQTKGAKYVLLISAATEKEFAQEVARRAVMSQRLGYMSMNPIQEKLSNMAAITISPRIASELLAGTSEKKLAQWKSSITKQAKPLGPNTAKGELKLKAERVSQEIETENVAGYLEGTDKKDEVLVITAHIDHIGISADGQINNGADDDGSGTVSVLELAEAFSKAKAEGHGPRRSILFMTVTGEEKGLFGSAYYSENPLLPLDKTIANLNIDMIGRVDKAHEADPRYVYLIGADKLSSELHAISEAANQRYVQYQLDYTFNDPKDPNRFYYRSDHYNFAKKGIPVVFYFTGVHEDYHRPGDEVEKIMFDKQVPIVKLVFHTAWELVNREERIKVDSNKP